MCCVFPIQHTTSDSNCSDLMDGLPVVKAVSLSKDGKKGFGFAIERGEKTQGSSAVMVATVTAGGPAELEGQIQVGDQILSVDGQKILGYAYEKVGGGCDRFLLLTKQRWNRNDSVVYILLHVSSTVELHVHSVASAKNSDVKFVRLITFLPIELTDTSLACLDNLGV